MQHVLLPFTHGIDRDAVNQALALARNLSARLVCVALIQLHPDNHKGIRLEYIQQAKDFLEYTRQRATRANVRLERMEIYTYNLENCILRLSQEMDNAPILLFMRDESGVMLELPTIINLLEDERCHYYLVLLARRNSSITVPQILSPIFKKYKGTRNEPALRFVTPQPASLTPISLRAIHTSEPSSSHRPTQH